MIETCGFDELRALAALEVELSAFIANRVADARRDGNMSWDEIAAAMGITRSGAWKRWRDVVEAGAVSPRPTGHLRRHGDRLNLSAEAQKSIPALASQLASRVLRSEDDAPWASTVRALLSTPSLPFTSQRTAHGTRFYVRGGDVVIECSEPGPETAAGGIVATVLPRSDPGVGDASAITKRLAPDGLLPPARPELVVAVKTFLEELLRVAEPDADSPA